SSLSTNHRRFQFLTVCPRFSSHPAFPAPRPVRIPRTFSRATAIASPTDRSAFGRKHPAPSVRPPAGRRLNTVRSGRGREKGRKKGREKVKEKKRGREREGKKERKGKEKAKKKDQRREIKNQTLQNIRNHKQHRRSTAPAFPASDAGSC